MAASSDPNRGALIWCALILVGAFIVFGMATWYVRRKFRPGDDDDAPSAGFTLSDLRDLHKKGQISDEEFERAKTKILAAAKAAMERDEERKRKTENRK